MRAPWQHGQARIIPKPGRLFDVGPEGEIARIVPVDEEMTDFIAWTDAAPQIWHWFFDPYSAPILNRDHIRRQVFENEPVTLFSTPARWLAAGCVGAVVLCPEIYLPLELGDVKKLVVDEDALRLKIERAFRPPLPIIRIAARGARHAA